MPKQQNDRPKETVEQTLDRIAESLSHLNRRDRIRTVWMTISSIVRMIPLFALLIGALYFYWEREDLLQYLITAIAKQLQTQGLQTGPLLQQLEQLLR